MPYTSNRQLPEGVKDNLPKQAQEIYREAFNNAEDFYQDPEKRRDKNETADEIAAKIAWSAVKKKFKKSDDKWVKKS